MWCPVWKHMRIPEFRCWLLTDNKSNNLNTVFMQTSCCSVHSPIHFVLKTSQSTDAIAKIFRALWGQSLFFFGNNWGKNTSVAIDNRTLRIRIIMVIIHLRVRCTCDWVIMFVMFLLKYLMLWRHEKIGRTEKIYICFHTFHWFKFLHFYTI